MNINIGMLLSYDYDFLKRSIPLIYKEASTITLAKDINNKTWSGNIFTIDPCFFKWLEEFDTEKKIRLYEDDFYIPTLSPFENDTLERNKLSLNMPSDGWYLQIDADEYCINFKGFCDYLKTRNDLLYSKKNVQIGGFLIILYKTISHGALYVSKPFERCYFATNQPNKYKYCRNTNRRLIYYPFFSLHQSWARDEKELAYKLNNWGHRDDFDGLKYLAFWKSINETNYKDVKNFHPCDAEKWQKLDLIEGDTVAEMTENLHRKNKIKQSSFFIFRKNLGQKIKFLFN